MKDKKRYFSNLSIRWRIFTYLLIFVILLLAILWVMQTMYLDTFYKNIKKGELKKAVNSVLEVLSDDNYKEALDEIAEEYDIRIVIGTKSGANVYTTGSNATEHIMKLGTEAMQQLFEIAIENDGEVQISNEAGWMNSFLDNKSETQYQKPPTMQESDRKEFGEMMDFAMSSEREILMIVRLVSINGQECVLLADSVITPVNATVDAIKMQLLYISLIMIVLAFVLAFLLANHISKPIIQISRTAKKISEGNLNIEFEQQGYREISELSDTLNYTVNEITKSQKLQRELIANVSHDLRTPLTMIGAYAEVMRDIPGENTPENVQVIIDETARLSTLVNDLLDMSKLQAGVTNLQLKEYNLTAGIRMVMQNYAKLKEKDQYQIQFVYEEDDIWVEADEFKIYQVLYNLVNNAIHYTGEDKKVTVKQIVNGGIVRIEVIDTGEGIAEEELANVWDRYYKIDKTHKRAVVGTGLGLSIVKNILILHDAKYGVNSRVGVGSTFWFELKIKQQNGRTN